MCLSETRIEVQVGIHTYICFPLAIEIRRLFIIFTFFKLKFQLKLKGTCVFFFVLADDIRLLEENINNMKKNMKKLTGKRTVNKERDYETSTNFGTRS